MGDLQKKSRAWSWTLFEYEKVESKILERFKEYDLKYVIWGREICPKTDKKHLQGFVYFYNPIKGETVKSCISDKAHVEISYANAAHNNKYCSKSGDIVEWGVLPRQGKRTDLIDVYRMCQEQCSEAEILESYPGQFIRYHSGISKARNICSNDRVSPPVFSWYWGPSGVGKTSSAIELSPNSYYIKDSTKWWNNYNNEKLIIIDDIKDGDFYTNIGEILRLADRYKISGEVKGGYVKINSEKIIVTCDRHPCKIWTDKRDLSQVIRRIEESGGEIKRIKKFEPFTISEEKMKEYMKEQ